MIFLSLIIHVLLKKIKLLISKNKGIFDGNHFKSWRRHLRAFYYIFQEFSQKIFCILLENFTIKVHNSSSRLAREKLTETKVHTRLRTAVTKLSFPSRTRRRMHAPSSLRRVGTCPATSVSYVLTPSRDSWKPRCCHDYRTPVRTKLFLRPPYYVEVLIRSD